MIVDEEKVDLTKDDGRKESNDTLEDEDIDERVVLVK
jgi:hypothetical protein